MFRGRVGGQHSPVKFRVGICRGNPSPSCCSRDISESSCPRAAVFHVKHDCRGGNVSVKSPRFHVQDVPRETYGRQAYPMFHVEHCKRSLMHLRLGLTGPTNSSRPREEYGPCRTSWRRQGGRFTWWFSILMLAIPGIPSEVAKVAADQPLPLAMSTDCSWGHIRHRGAQFSRACRGCEWS